MHRFRISQLNFAIYGERNNNIIVLNDFKKLCAPNIKDDTIKSLIYASLLLKL